jgi:predicted HicB family RNase H-like nuclease
VKTYQGFIADFHVDFEEGIIRGRVINTRDMITFYGKTAEEASDEFKKSVDEYLAFCQEIGVEPEKPFSGRILVRVNPSMHRQLSLRAQRAGQSINKLIVGELSRSLKDELSDEPEATEFSDPVKIVHRESRLPTPKSKVRAGSK